MGKYFRAKETSAPDSLKNNISSNIPNSNTLLEKINDFFVSNSNLFPFALIFIFSFILFIKGTPISDLFAPILIFFTGYLTLNLLLKINKISSSLFALPFSLVFCSLAFRIGLFFGSNSVVWGFASIFFFFALLVILLWYFKPNLSFLEDVFSFESIGLIAVCSLLFGILSLSLYDLYLGHIIGDKVFWGSNDSNWQISTLSYIKSSGVFQIPPYLCQGLEGFDLDAQTSTLSLVSFYLFGFLSSSYSGSHFVSLNLLFVFLLIGVLLLFSKIFGTKRALFTPLLALLPFSFQLLLPDILGMWRVSLFDFILPFCLFFSIFLSQRLSSYLLLFLFWLFAFLIQPFESLLLLPSIFISLFNSRSSLNLPVLVSTAVAFIIFAYFLFFQITFNTIGSAVSIANSPSFPAFGFDAISIVESFESLIPRLQISMVNLGPLSLLICTFVILYCIIKLPSSFSKSENSNLTALYFTILFGAFICSGILVLSPSTIQYILKTRYSFFLVLVFPLFTAILSGFSENPLEKKFVFIIAVLATMSYSYLSLTISVPNEDIFERDALFSWFKTQNVSNKTLLVPESFLGQSASYHFGLRSLYLSDSDVLNAASGNFSFAEHTFLCNYKRDGLLVNYTPLNSKFSSPDYAVIIRPELDPNYSQIANLLILRNYSVVFNTPRYVVYSGSG